MSGLKIKAIKNQYLTGIEIISSAAPIISKIVFNYKIPSGISFIPEVIAENTVDNNGSMTMTQQLTL